jgi:hypothetical protein
MAIHRAEGVLARLGQKLRNYPKVKLKCDLWHFAVAGSL